MLQPTERAPAADLARNCVSRMADELYAQYLFAFAPPRRDGKVHDVEVRVVKRGLKARARKTYVVPKG